ncbi:hypothetical protein Nitsa_1185 [Nitratifractor salsuginis DSM 16511]|uniref:Uncharacterized protein n=1 Tax=Nitratifractor salsuginis (strain DSM 16511 / JCM 12458 / E9I37-1) TaxID=749222 RepID=E6WYC6_NITSE|nr:hypothetical protein Nitsa_1185 [Nitratifractor salsuginis DSM 16511]
MKRPYPLNRYPFALLRDMWDGLRWVFGKIMELTQDRLSKNTQQTKEKIGK